MSTQIKQKKYLKKYLSKEDKVKKRKRTTPIGSTRVKIIDDDVDIRKIQVENDDELILSGDEAPQIVGVTSAGSPVPKAVDNFRYSGKWKNLSGNNESDPTDSLTEKSIFSKKISEKLKLFHDGNMSGGRSHKTDISKRPKYEKNSTSISKGDSDNSPPRKPSAKHSDDSDYSPPRKNNSGKLRQSPSKYQSPPRNSPQKRRSSDDYSPPRKSDKSSKKYEAVSSKQHYNSDSDYSPKRSSSKFQDKNSDYTPKRRANKNLSDDDFSPSRKSAKTKILDDLPAKQPKHLGHSTKSLEKGRRSKSSDYSPPRKNNDSNHGDLSPPRKAGLKQSQSLDYSPSRRSQKNPSESRSNIIRGGRNKSSRWGSRDKSPSRQSGDRSPKQRSRDRSPKRRSRDRSPRRRSRDRSPSRRSRDRSPRRRSTERFEGETSSHSSNMNTETNKATFGLRKGGPDDNKKRQNPFSKDYHEDIPDKDQELMTRNRKRVPDEVKERAREEKMKREQEKKELYSKWNRGLRQIEEYKTKAADDRKEADKPLARYANDEDLDTMLKQQERIGDPMLEYMREKQREKRKQDKVLEFPAYKGIAPENRFQIRPGYRWDGVDRSNGYEKKWFDFQSEKKANIEESYKYDEDYM